MIKRKLAAVLLICCAVVLGLSFSAMAQLRLRLTHPDGRTVVLVGSDVTHFLEECFNEGCSEHELEEWF